MRRFRLRTVFIIVLLAAIGSLALNEILRTRPPSQKPYSSAELQRLLRSGKPVLVTIDASWSIHTTNRPRYMSAEVSRRIREKDMVAMTADWTNKSPAIDALMASLNRNAVPTLVLYSPNDAENPVVVPEQASDSQILNAIDDVLKK